jgi:hypothetical protein
MQVKLVSAVLMSVTMITKHVPAHRFRASGGLIAKCTLVLSG